MLDQEYVSKYYEEYLDHVNRFQNLKRTGIFCRYFSISEKNNPNINYDKKSIYYNVYDYIPTNRVDVIQDDVDTRTSELSIILYGISVVKVNDMVIFPYKPNNSSIFFRVKGLSDLRNTTEVSWTSVRLEYTTINDTFDLKVMDNYIYFIPINKTIQTKKYLNLMKKLKRFEEFLNNRLIFDNSRELYSTIIIRTDERLERLNLKIKSILNKYNFYFKLTTKYPIIFG